MDMSLLDDNNGDEGEINLSLFYLTRKSEAQ